MVDPVIIDTSITPTYSWQCDTSCFADGLITRNITRQLTDMDSGLIECSVTIDGDEYMSDNMFDLQVSQGINVYVIWQCIIWPILLENFNSTLTFLAMQYTLFIVIVVCVCVCVCVQ